MLEFLVVCGEELLEALPYLHSNQLRYGGWTDPRGFERQLQRLESKGWIHMGEGRDETGWIAHLTEFGDDVLNDSIDPQTAWSASWDGEWTLITFDIPARDRSPRRQLNEWLRKRRFGHLQGSLWVAPRYLATFADELAARSIDPQAVLLFRGNCIAGLTHDQIVRKAWNHLQINEHYRDYVAFLDVNPPENQDPIDRREEFADWFRLESEIWRKAFSHDPFLPRSITPAGYLGEEAWARRNQAYHTLRAANHR